MIFTLCRRLALPLAVMLTIALAGFVTITSCSKPQLRQDSVDLDGKAADQVAPPMEDLGASAYEAALRLKLDDVPPEESEHLHNVYRLSENIVSGSEPHGEEAFEKLQTMGVKTILSVDGKVPDADLAAKYGMKYVHVPIQYSGIDDAEMLRIAKTFRELEGPFFVHCFHGKHRGPAAAAVGRVVLDGATRERAIAEMRQWCGTADKYEGLYRTIATGGLPAEETTQSYEWDFPAAHELTGFRHAMIEVSRIHDHLKYLYRRNWEPDADHPDLDSLNEAAKLAMIYEGTNELEDVTGRPEDFRRWLQGSVGASATLRDSLAAWRAGEGGVEAVDAAYDEITNLCSSCHKSYRNN